MAWLLLGPPGCAVCCRLRSELPRPSSASGLPSSFNASSRTRGRGQLRSQQLFLHVRPSQAFLRDPRPLLAESSLRGFHGHGFTKMALSRLFLLFEMSPFQLPSHTSVLLAPTHLGIAWAVPALEVWFSVPSGTPGPSPPGPLGGHFRSIPGSLGGLRAPCVPPGHSAAGTHAGAQRLLSKGGSGND